MGFLDDVVSLVRERSVVYLREAQVLMEQPPQVEHWAVANALKILSLRGRVSTRLEGLRWYYDVEKSWDEVKVLAAEKARLVDTYSGYPNEFVSQPEGLRYDDISEYFVEDALRKAGFVVFARSTNYFDGRAYLRQGRVRGRPPDLDFTAGAYSDALSIGVSVKNLLDYPKEDAVDQLLDMCEVLHLKPVLVARIASGKQARKISEKGGYTVMFKWWMLQPGMEREIFNKISAAGRGSSVLNLPVAIYQYTPAHLYDSVAKMKGALIGQA